MASITVEGMKCNHCVHTVTKALEALDGVGRVQVDLASGQVTFEGSPDPEKVKEVIRAKGFTVVA